MSAPAPETMRRGWCPGTLRPMRTGDGLLVRLHPPRNALTPDALGTIAGLASRHGNGQIEISGRGHLQLRGLAEDSHPRLVAALLEAGLVDEAQGAGPNRLVLTSPLAGRAADELIDAAALAQRLEQTGHAHPGLPAKFSIVVDGGGALALDGVAADIRLLALATDAIAIGLPGDLWLGPVRTAAASDQVAQLLRGFLARGAARMRDLDREALAGLAAAGPLVVIPAPPRRPAPACVGIAPEKDGRFAVLAGLVFGRADAAGLLQIARLAREAQVEEIRPSPWRGLAFCGLRRDGALRLRAALAGEGLITAGGDPRLAVSACAGAPSCARGEAPALADAARLAETLAPLLAQGLSLHVSGCAKSCARAGRAGLTLVGAAGVYDVVIGGGARDPAFARLSLSELVQRLGPGQDIRARLEAARQQDQRV
jgi:precorrin-3B synthase